MGHALYKEEKALLELAYRDARHVEIKELYNKTSCRVNPEKQTTKENLNDFIVLSATGCSLNIVFFRGF